MSLTTLLSVGCCTWTQTWCLQNLGGFLPVTVPNITRTGQHFSPALPLLQAWVGIVNVQIFRSGSIVCTFLPDPVCVGQLVSSASRVARPAKVLEI